MAGYSVPKDSAYYYGEDGTYIKKRRAPKPAKTNLRPEYNLDAQGLPVRVNPVANSQGKIYGSLPRSANDNLAAYDSSVTLPGMASSGNAGNAQSVDPKGDAYIKPSAPKATRNVERNGAQGTQTSPSAAKPGDLNAFADLLGSKYGVQFRGGFESNHLPSKSGYSVVDDVAMGGNAKEALAKKNGGFVEVEIDGSDMKTTVVNRGEIAEGAQKGTSAVPDAGDQKRAVRVGRMDPRQRGGAQTGFNGADFSGAEPDDASLTSGISARSRAFLDAPMGQGAMALRHAEASQGYIRQNGKNYAITGTGEDGKRTFQEFSDEGKNALQSDGNKTIGQEFLKKYMVGETDAKAAENPAVENPVAVNYSSTPNWEAPEGIAPKLNYNDTEAYGKVSDEVQGMTAKGPYPGGAEYGNYIDGIEPMMRFNQKDAPSFDELSKQYGKK